MNNKIIITAVVTLIVGVAAGYLLAPTKEMTAQAPAQQAASEEKKPLFYRNPMNPNVTSSVPAKDQMGMDYIPVYSDGGAGSDMPAGTVTIDPVTEQNIGVRTSIAERKTLSRTIRSVGRIAFNEERVTRLHPKVEGWIEKLFIDKTGERVNKDTMLLSIYSPQLMATEEEYLLALNNAETLKESPFKDIREGAASLMRSARERLELFDVPAHQIKELERTRKVKKNLHIHSPFDGVIMKIGARKGQRITPQTELYMIADLSKVWAVVDLYEDDMPWVREGDQAEMKVAGIPGKTFMGKVTYIYPYLEAKTRTLKIRLEFNNPNFELKPDMFANVTVNASKKIDAVVIPSEAIVRTGAREQVFVKHGAGKFEPRIVTVGISADGETQIIDGVKAGEEIVSSSQFLIDSESKLREATAKMLEASESKLHNHDKSKPEMKMDMKEHDMTAPAPSHDMDHNMDHGSMNHGEMNHDTMNHSQGAKQ